VRKETGFLGKKAENSTLTGPSPRTAASFLSYKVRILSTEKHQKEKCLGRQQLVEKSRLKATPAI